MPKASDTQPPAELIAAIATAPGRGGIGVVRISGAGLTAWFEPLLGRTLVPRRAHLARFLDAQGEVLDQGIAIWFDAPHSYTGEDVLELQGHGGPAVLQLLLERCLQLGARLARPGEFTERAFLNDKLDLAQAESVADLIDATSTQAARGAMRSLQGVFSQEINRLVDQLIQVRMLVEAALDFPEEDIELVQQAQVMERLGALSARLHAVLKAAGQGRALRDGLHVVLVGQPNVGKSSLLNQLAGDEVAIVTEVAGTTRDTIRELIHLDGVPLHLTDTAGLRDSADRVEQLGMERTWAAVEKADVVLVMLDVRTGLGLAEQQIVQRLPAQVPQVHVHNKIDLTQTPPQTQQLEGGYRVDLSAKTGLGVDALRQVLLRLAGWEGQQEATFLARARHVEALSAAAAALIAAAEHGHALDLLAEELRVAQTALSRITGEFSADDLLGTIFSQFCIGK